MHKTYKTIKTAKAAIKKGVLARAGYVFNELTTDKERFKFLDMLYPYMPDNQIRILIETMKDAYTRGQAVQEELYKLGYERNVPKGVRQ